MAVASRSSGDEALGQRTAVPSENYGCRGVVAATLCQPMWFSRVHRPHRSNRRHLAPGSYLTDGERLFRVTSLFVNGGSTLVSIEDCRTLETHAYAGSELETMRLRRVRGEPCRGARLAASSSDATRSLSSRSLAPPRGRA
jgi:hypothetical protein